MNVRAGNIIYKMKAYKLSIRSIFLPSTKGVRNRIAIKQAKRAERKR